MDIKKINKRAQASLELILIIVAVFAFSYLINQTSPKEIIPRVSAKESYISCCEKTKEGMYCQDVLNIGECDANFRAENTECRETDYCLGCCIDDVQGTYDKSVPEILCEGRWEADKNCNVAGSDLGCCVTGEDIAYTSEQNCEKLSEQLGLEKDYRANMSETDCIGLRNQAKKGACVFEGSNCQILSQQECLSLTRDESMFHEGLLCTSPSLNTICEKTEMTTCVEGKDEVYFLDSCGNPSNIYDSTRINDIRYWNTIFEKKDSCNSNSGNADSRSCGNCDKVLGGICSQAEEIKPSIGDFICQSTSCQYNGKTYKNGESWCVYESKIDQGDDVVGSRHTKLLCSLGEVQEEPCRDYRQEICVQDTIEIENVTQEEMTHAECVVNPWRECIDNEECPAKKCIKKSINIDEFSFDLCTPRYPPGFEFLEKGKQTTSTTSGSNAKKTIGSKEICKKADQTCTVIYIKNMAGSCECDTNCGCEEEDFTNQMNEMCRSLGDCGAYVNVAGKYTDGGYTISGAPEVGQSLIQEYKKKIIPKPGKFAEPYGNTTTHMIPLAGLANGASADEWGGIGSPIGIGLASGAGAGAGLVGLGVAIGGAVGLAVGIAGAIIAVFAIILLLLFLLLGIGQICKEVDVVFECKPWERPAGAKDCEKCNELDTECTEYKCQSLGAACELKGKGTSNPLCVPKQDDGSPPKVSPDLTLQNEEIEYKEITSSGFKISNKEGGCFQAYQDFALGVTTDEEANCKFGFESASYENLTMDFGSNAYEFNHSTIFFLPEPSHFEQYFTGLEGAEIPQWEGDLDLHVKCIDVYGNTNPEDYKINVCVNPGPDITPPTVKFVSPAEDNLIRNDIEYINASFYITEPSECKWSKQDLEYDSMENLMDCVTRIDGSTSYGYKCGTSLDLSEPTANKFYIKCRDQPWFDAVNRSEERNTMAESYEYTLNKIENPLTITKISPEGDINVQTNPSTVDLKVVTSGGGNSPKCSWSKSGYDEMYEFYDTYSHNHFQELELVVGGHKIYIQCEDEIGETVKGETYFTLLR